MKEKSNNMGDDQDSVDDPVEDAALLGDECEIKRDSICSFEEHTDSVLCVAFNPMHPLQLATGGQDEQAFLLQLSDQETPSISSCHLNGHQDSVCSVAFSYTGEYLATADMNGVIKVWKSSNGQLLKTLQGPEDLEWIRWHSKSNILLASGNDYTIWSWSLPKGFALPVGRGRR